MISEKNNIKLKKIKYYSNFNINDIKNKAYHVYPKNIEEIKKIFLYAKKNNKKILCVGNSKSWFDTISNKNGIIINLKNFKKILSVQKKNILKVSSNIKLNEIYNFLISKNLTLFNFPGYSNITIGGSISNNVHGKDSFRFGTFGEKIISMKILLPTGEIKNCSTKKDKNLFYAIIGGLGLIGIILEIQIKLKKISKNVVTNSFKCKNYKEIITTIYSGNYKYDYIYSWIDTQRERGIIYKSKYYNGKINTKKKITFKFKDQIIKIILSFFMKNNLMNIINFFFYLINKKHDSKIERVQNLINLSQSNFIDLPELISPHSFVEIQFIIPQRKNFLLKKFFRVLKEESLSSLITGIKLHKKSLGYLSFADNGLSISINLICNFNDKEKITKLRKINSFLVKNNLKIYLCKDFFINKNDIKKIYPEFNKFLNIKKKYDEFNILYSDFLKRVV